MATPALLTAGHTASRTVIGSVDTCEFIVALAASTDFFLGLGSEVHHPHQPPARSCGRSASTARCAPPSTR